MKKRNNFTLWLFYLILILPVIVLFISKKTNTSNEKRALTPFPKLQWTSKFPEQFELYFNDNFGLRELFVEWNSKLKINVFGDSPKPELALFGKDGFIFYNAQSDWIYQYYSNTTNISKQEIIKGLSYQKSVKNKLNKLGIDYILGFFPNKHTIYSDKLPLAMSLQITNKPSFTNEFISYFNENNFDIIDIRKQLFENKNLYQLYYKLDTHWNSRGAFIGYQNLFNQAFSVLNIKPFDISEFDISPKKIYTGDLTQMMGLGEGKGKGFSDIEPVFTPKDTTKTFERIKPIEGFPPGTIITKNNNAKDLRKVVIYRDSYSTALVQFISLHFKEVIYIKQNKIDIDFVEKLKPDVVMSICVERYLHAKLTP